MQHQRHLPGTVRAQPAGCAASPRHARLFELWRQQTLAQRALVRLHRRAPGAAQMQVPSAAALAASLLDQSASSPP